MEAMVQIQEPRKVRKVGRDPEEVVEVEFLEGLYLLELMVQTEQYFLERTILRKGGHPWNI